MPTIYLTGKITGEDNYKEKFLKKASILSFMGYRCANVPTRRMASWDEYDIDHQTEEESWEDWMRNRIERLITCNGIAFLEDWRDSRSCIMEFDVAKRLKMPMKFFNGDLLEDLPQKGIKFDDQKIKWNLVDLSLLHGLIRVLMYGSKKYSDFNWQVVPDAKKRYFESLMRHITEYQNGKEFDEESGQKVIDHMLANCYFLKYLQENENHGCVSDQK